MLIGVQLLMLIGKLPLMLIGVFISQEQAAADAEAQQVQSNVAAMAALLGRIDGGTQ